MFLVGCSSSLIVLDKSAASPLAAGDSYPPLLNRHSTSGPEHFRIAHEERELRVFFHPVYTARRQIRKVRLGYSVVPPLFGGTGTGGILGSFLARVLVLLTHDS